MMPKFRAWDKRENNWVDYPIYIDANGDVYWENYERGLQEADDLIVMQSTGLKDKNGVEIFEGDIVKVRDGDDEEDSYISVVKNYSDEGYPAFDIEYPSEWHYESNVLLAIENNPYETIEVIGNIYENPELLEVGE